MNRDPKVFVSKRRLPRYLADYDYLWKCRNAINGDRTLVAIQSAEDKRLISKMLLAG